VETGDDAKTIPFLKRFTVFNTDQCDGLPDDVAKVVLPPPPEMIKPEARTLIAATGADFRIGGARAFYNPSADFVQVPPPQAYFEPPSMRSAIMPPSGLCRAGEQSRGRVRKINAGCRHNRTTRCPAICGRNAGCVS
jgi:antirestriction protein ArdC